MTKRAKVRCRPTKSRKIIKKHTESSYAYFPILFHIRIFLSFLRYSVCCVRQPRKKGWERDALLTHWYTHVYTYYLCCFIISFFSCFLKNISCVVKISHQEKRERKGKNKKKNINRTKEYQHTNNDVDGVKKMYMRGKKKNVGLRLGELTKHTAIARREKKWRGKRRRRQTNTNADSSNDILSENIFLFPYPN